MNKLARINYLRVLLLKKGKINTSEVSKELNISRRTVKRDLDYLSSINLAVLYHGGAVKKDFIYDDNFNDMKVKRIMSNIRNFETDHTKDKKCNDSSLRTDVYILGSFNMDIVSVASKLPKPGQTVHAKSSEFYVGGKGTNQAIAAAKVSSRVHLAVKIGQDEFGNKAKDYLASSDINSLSIFEDQKHSTGNAVILVDAETGENMITIDLGANKNITHDEILSEFILIESSSIFLTQLENNIEITKVAVEYANGTNALVILNPAPYSDKLQDMLNMIDIITPNETEAEDISGITINSIASAKEAAVRIHSMGVRIVIITLGSKGVIMYDGNKCYFFNAYKSVVNDTSGAGDAFNGSLAAKLSTGANIMESIAYANAFASLAVERKGASNMPENNLVLSRMQNNGIPFYSTI